MKTAVLDIGGTFIKSAIYEEINGNGALGPVDETPTEGALGAEALLKKAAGLVASLGAVDAIGVCTRGQVDCDEGRIIFDPPEIIPGYTGTNLKRAFGRFGVPVFVENDVNCMALAEARFGAGRGAKELVCLTFGTAIGGAILHNGALYHGAGFSAGEFGMMYIRGDFFENAASTTALVKMARAMDPSINNGRDVAAALTSPAVLAAAAAWAEIAAEGIASIIHALDPEAAVLGGGIMENERIFSLVRERANALTAPGFTRDIRAALHGNRAGLMGAAAVAHSLCGEGNPCGG